MTGNPSDSPTTGAGAGASLGAPPLDLEAIKARLENHYGGGDLWNAENAPEIADIESLLAELARLQSTLKEQQDQYALLAKRESVAMVSLGDWMARAEKAEASLSALQEQIREVKAEMMAFATTRPSPQQTRQKSAREMVEIFAYKLADSLAALHPKEHT